MVDLLGPDWAIPVTEDFVARVGRGVARRRRQRRWGTAGALVLVVALALVGIASLTPHSAVTPARPPVDTFAGFSLGGLPAGITWAPPDGSSSAVVGPHGADFSGPQPVGSEPGVTLRQRRYAHPDGGSALFVDVIRPLTGTSAPPAQISAWTVQGLLEGWTDGVDTLTVPAGTAYLTRFQGSEVTAHSLVLITPDGTVVSVSGDAGTATDPALRQFAQQLRQL